MFYALSRLQSSLYEIQQFGWLWQYYGHILSCFPREIPVPVYNIWKSKHLSSQYTLLVGPDLFTYELSNGIFCDFQIPENYKFIYIQFDKSAECVPLMDLNKCWLFLYILCYIVNEGKLINLSRKRFFVTQKNLDKKLCNYYIYVKVEVELHVRFLLYFVCLNHMLFYTVN